MTNRDNDFLESLKVPEAQKENNRENSFSDRDVYTCLKLMGDTYKVVNFLLSTRIQKDDGKTQMSLNYFYTINAKLGYAEFDFREGRIDSNEFNRRINEVCKSYNLDFNYLMELVDQIALLQKQPNSEKSLRLAENIKARVAEEIERRNSENQQGKN